MKPSFRFLLIVASCAVLLAMATPAKAESITLSLNSVSQGTFSCTGSNGCFGNDITLDVSGSSTNWTVTITFDTTGNTNPGAGIGSISFILTGFSYVGGDVSLTSFSGTGGAAGWTVAPGPTNASGSGCQAVSSNSICSFDTSAITMGTGLDASPLGPGNTYTWTWTITNQSFGGFDSDTHIQALFGSLGTCTGAAKGPPNEGCFDETGLISSNAVPEPGTMALFGTGLLGLAGAIRRRMKG
jgi:hypothetical protein